MIYLGRNAIGVSDTVSVVPIDDTAGTGDTTKVWSADKSATEVNNLKSAINDKADVIISSASGAIASFSDGADGLPVKELVVGIEPVQDLHGYDHPWPAGGGKNLFGGEYGTKWILPTPLSISAGDSLAISASIPASGNSRINIYTGENGATRYFNAGLNDTVNGRKVRIATFVEDITITAFLMDVAECTDIQIEKGSTATAYAPYENLCPISGWDAVKVTRTGKNLWSGTLANNVNVVFDTKPGQTYTASAKLKGTNDCYLYVQSSVDGFQTSELVGRILAAQRVATVTFTAEAGKEYALWSNASYTEADQIQVELGSTATAYEAPNVQTYSITLPSSAGTVYGGELTVNEDGTGTLKVEKAKYISNANKLVNFYNGTSTTGAGYTLDAQAVEYTASGAYPNAISSICKTLLQIYWAVGQSAAGLKNRCDNETVNYSAFSINGRYLTIYDPDNTISEADFKEKYNSAEFVYQLETPVEYQLSIEQVATLLGQNSIWADAGDVAVSYRADTKLYIDNKITQAIAAALNA